MTDETPTPEVAAEPNAPATPWKRYVAILLDGPEPRLVDLQFLGDDGSVRSVVDVERDGGLELELSRGLGDVALVRADGSTLSEASTLWWSFCPC